MLTSVKLLWVVVNLFCTAVLVIQLANILTSYIKPTLTRTWEEEVLLADIDFPVIVKICFIPGFNEEALRENGYDDTWNYFLGKSMFDEYRFGWAGHKNESDPVGNRTVEGVLDQVNNFDVEHILDNIYVWTKDKESINIPLEHLQSSQVNYPHNCLSLSLANISELDGKVIQELFIEVDNLDEHSIQVQLRGENLDCKRDIKDQSLHSSGDTIKLDVQNVSVAYMVEISQRIFVEEDRSHICQNYPTSDFASYSQCDDAFMRDLIPDTITPIWLADNISEVSTQVYDENGTFGKSSYISCYKYNVLLHWPKHVKFMLLM